MKDSYNDDKDTKSASDILAPLSTKEIQKEFIVCNEKYNTILDESSKTSMIVSMFTTYLEGNSKMRTVDIQMIQVIGGDFLAYAILRKICEVELLKREDENGQGEQSERPIN